MREKETYYHKTEHNILLVLIAWNPMVFARGWDKTIIDNKSGQKAVLEH